MANTLCERAELERARILQWGVDRNACGSSVQPPGFRESRCQRPLQWQHASYGKRPSSLRLLQSGGKGRFFVFLRRLFLF